MSGNKNENPAKAKLEIDPNDPKRVKQPEDAYLLETARNVIVVEISSYLNNKEVANLSESCGFLYTTCEDDINKRALKKLLQAVLDDDRKTVKRILDARPDLLLLEPKEQNVKEIQSQTTWHCFRAEKALTMATKTNMLEMVKLLIPYFEELEKRGHIKDGKAEVLKQSKVRVISEEEKAQYKNKMQQLADVIMKENGKKGNLSKETEEALDEFRKSLLPACAIVLDDYVDVEQLLIAAYRAFDRNFMTFTRGQSEIFSIHVIGFIQSLLRPDDGKAFCQGLNEVVEHRAIGERAESLKLLDDKENNTPFYRSGPSSLSGLGFDYVCGSDYTVDARDVGGHAFANGALSECYLKKYVEQKQQELAIVCLSEGQGVGRDQGLSNHRFV